MARTPRDITDAELSVLQVLWEEGSATIRRIADALYPRGTASHYATVQKLLERLEDKGCVRRDRSENVHSFRAAVGRDELVGRRLKDLAEKLCGGSWTPLLTQLVQQGKLSARDRQSLRDLVDDLSASPEDHKRKGKP